MATARFHSQFWAGLAHTRGMTSPNDSQLEPQARESDRAELARRDAAAKARLRALLDGTQLTPEQTSDDIAPPENVASRDSELKADVPPHHG